MRRTEAQKKTYRSRRCSMAIDRLILAQTAEEKDQARKWAMAWAYRAGLPRQISADSAP